MHTLVSVLGTFCVTAANDGCSLEGSPSQCCPRSFAPVWVFYIELPFTSEGTVAYGLITCSDPYLTTVA